MKRLVLFFTTIFFLIGCAPKGYYGDTQSKYHKSYKDSYRACFQICKDNKLRCHEACEQQYFECKTQAEDKARANYKQLEQDNFQKQEEYKADLDYYNDNMKIWRQNINEIRRKLLVVKSECKRYADNVYCENEINALRNEIFLIKDRMPQKPSPPPRIYLSDEIKKEQSVCNRDCFCGKEYGSCLYDCKRNKDIFNPKSGSKQSFWQ